MRFLLLYALVIPITNSLKTKEEKNPKKTEGLAQDRRNANELDGVLLCWFVLEFCCFKQPP